MTAALPVAAPSLPDPAIRVARVLCLLGIVYVHAWTGRSGGELDALAASGQGIFRIALIDLFGRSSVPLLSIISGFLVAGSLRHRDYRRFVAGKARTILLPMVAWNALAILLVSGAAWLWDMRAPVPDGLPWVVDEMLALTRPNHINVQMPFLRDLFVCMLLVPPLLRADSRVLAVGAAAVLFWAEQGWPLWVLLRPQILAFFVIGILVRRHGLAAPLAGRFTPVAVALFLAVAIPKIALVTLWPGPAAAHPHILRLLDLALRFAGAWLFWQISWRIARTAALVLFERLEPMMFLLFCAHLILMWLGGPLIGSVVGRIGAPLYPLLFAAQPLLVLAATIGIAAGLRWASPDLLRVLSGNRLRLDQGTIVVNR